MLKHPKFQEFFGQNSSFFDRLGSSMEYSYRHTKAGFKENDVSDYESNHDSYFHSGDGHTHFFLGTEAYGAN